MGGGKSEKKNERTEDIIKGGSYRGLWRAR